MHPAVLKRWQALYCTVLYCTVMYCTVLYCTVLYCTPTRCEAPSWARPASAATAARSSAASGVDSRAVNEISQYFHNFTQVRPVPLRRQPQLRHGPGQGQLPVRLQEPGPGHHGAARVRDQVLYCTVLYCTVLYCTLLEFGIRFFDIDVIFSHALGCNGLETGHGAKPEVGLYQEAFTSTVTQSET